MKLSKESLKDCSKRKKFTQHYYNLRKKKVQATTKQSGKKKSVLHFCSRFLMVNYYQNNLINLDFTMEGRSSWTFVAEEIKKKSKIEPSLGNGGLKVV